LFIVTEEELCILYCIFSDLSGKTPYITYRLNEKLARDYGIITKETFLRFFGLTVWNSIEKQKE